jgi:hypothetical protein
MKTTSNPAPAARSGESLAANALARTVDTLVERQPRSLDDADRRRAVFDGRVLAFSPPPASFRRLQARTLALMADCFAVEPALAHRLSRRHFLDAVLALQTAFCADPVIRECWYQTLRRLGVSAAVFSDQRFLRVLPPLGSHTAGRIAPLHPHRDTWGSQVMQQENWWAPILPVGDASTLALYPRYWSEPIANDSGTWSFDEYRAQRRAAGDDGDIDTLSAPRPLHWPAACDRLPLRISAGELAVFSGAHLHASMPNRSGLTRFSFETRTVVLCDGVLPPGAPNIDGPADRPRHDWFRDADGRSLRTAFGAGTQGGAGTDRARGPDP